MAHSLRLVATNYRPTGIKPVEAKRRKKCFTALRRRGEGLLTRQFYRRAGLHHLPDLKADERRWPSSRDPFNGGIETEITGWNQG